MKKSNKSPRHQRTKKKRHKKYKGAATQSARPKAEHLDVILNYRPAIDFISSYNANINSLTNQLSFLTDPLYKPSLLKALNGIQEKLSTFNNLGSMLPQFDFANLNTQAFDLSRNATMAFTNLSNPNLVNDLASLITPNYPEWYNETIAKNSLLSSQAFADLDRFKSSKSLVDMFGAQNLSAFCVQSSLAKATELSLFTEKSLSNFSWPDLGQKIGLDAYGKSILGESFISLSTEYSALLKSFEIDPYSYVELSPTLTTLAPVELYTGANLIELLSTEEEITTEEELLKNEVQYENEYSLNLYLPKINVSLLNIWKGAIESFNSNNADKTRQFTVSLRELFTHVMHLLAPDDRVKDWTKDEAFFNQGRPTRKARLHYICRNISNKPFDKFVEMDVLATLEIINLFQEGTHSIQSNFTQAQLIAMKSKAETTLKFLLEIEFSTNR